MVWYTFSGKYSGNQLIIPALFESMVTGLVESSTFPYSTVSKYAPRPWQIPRSRHGKESRVRRTLCALGIVDDVAGVGGMLGFGCEKVHAVCTMGVGGSNVGIDDDPCLLTLEGVD